MIIGISHYLILSGLLFSIGFIGVLRRTNLLMIFFAIEIMLNAVNIGFTAIGNYYGDLSGQIFSFFIIAVAASEVAVGLGLLIVLYKKYGSLDLKVISSMKG